MDYFYYDGDKITAEREGNRWVVRYLLGIKPCGFVANGQVRIYHSDRLGSIRWVTDEGQNIMVSYVYEGFGKIVGQNGSGGGPYQFCGLWGYRNDWDAGLMHVGARYYEVETGRWVQKDPLIIGDVLDPMTLNRYIYVEDNPINLVDPTELIAWKIVFVGLTLVALAGWVADQGGYQWGDEVSDIATGIPAIIEGIGLLPTPLGPWFSGKLIGVGVCLVVSAVVDLILGRWHND